jgi:hypothetical protein
MSGSCAPSSNPVTATMLSQMVIRYRRILGERLLSLCRVQFIMPHRILSVTVSLQLEATTLMA